MLMVNLTQDQMVQPHFDGPTTTITFEDGNTAEVPTEHASEVVGYHAIKSQWYGEETFILIGASDHLLYGLTWCCFASGKGSSMAESGVVCRRCYDEVDGLYGDTFGDPKWTPVVKRVS